MQALVPAYQFNCTGTITGWTAFVDGARPSRIDFQVWRHVSTSREDTYQLLAANSYPQLMPRMKRISISVPRDLQIAVQPGDVLGVYVGREGDLKIKAVPSDNAITFTIEHVSGPRSIFSTTSLDTRRYNRKAPLIAVDVQVGKMC